MVYEKFLETVRSSVQEQLEPGTVAGLCRVLRNNGVTLDGLSFSAPGTPLSPTVYLNSYYDAMENGLPLSAVTSQILLLYEEQQLPQGLEIKLTDWDRMRGQIVYKLIGTAGNEELLADLPHFRYLDLAVVFYLILSDEPDGQMTVLIHNEHLKLWNTGREQLMELSEKNTPALLPPLIRPIEEVILENERSAGEDESIPDDLMPVYLYVLTNQSGINGAACLLYPDVLKNFADTLEDDLIVLPSSIHEVLLAPAKKALSYSELNEMVESINQSDVPAEDRLSNHIYRYCREQGGLMIPSISSGSAEKMNLQ